MDGNRSIAVNRKARYEYDILDSIEAGLVLVGTEIKAIREGRANFSDSYARPENGEIWLMNAHISQYSASGGQNDHDPKRPRKLLLHKEQIVRLTRQVDERGLTLVPLKLYLKRQRAKVQLGVARGRKRHDKRRAIIDREREKEARMAVRHGS
ncbi:MAG: SsrA-binding protein SmpB [Chloroflexi bacterium]|nr:SsrA-binding protein SmpB [Chloroflexota bacterium]